MNFFSTSPHENGFLTFVIGIVFVLTVYHFALYFQHKNKTYIYYSTYTFLIFLTYVSMSKNDFLSDITEVVQPFFKITHLAWVWLYNIFYFFFVFDFLNFQKHFPKKTKVIKVILHALSILAVIACTITLYFNDISYITNAYTLLFLPIIIILTFFGFYMVYNASEPARYYILFGSFILFVSSILGTLAVDFGLVFESKETGYLAFYIGLIIENIFFSLGLGFRQKLIINERNKVNKQLIKNLKEQINLKEEIENLRLTALRSQMNPHFIFNALNSIKLYIINNDSKNAAHYLNKFSKLIRKILEASSYKKITLKEELETMDLYLTIENIRFSDEINFEVLIDDGIDLNRINIPPLILQPFLENAIWHGLSSKKGKKNITIHISQNSAEFSQIVITDNGIGRKASNQIKQQKSIHRKSIGIELTKERLNNFVKNLENNFTLSYKDLIDGNLALGTEVTIQIPLT